MNNNDFYEALMDGRWQPMFSGHYDDKTDEYVAQYVQGENVIERRSKWNYNDAENMLHDEIRRGALEGEYYPIIG